MTSSRLWGVVAEFESPTTLLVAAHRVREAGYRRIDAHVPFPIEGLPEALGFGRTGIPFLVLCGALLGAAGGYFMEWYGMAVWYPLNVGGRPLNSWPLFVPITFELAVLVGPVGSGKSTLLRLITGEERPTRGAVLVDGVEVGTLGPGGNGTNSLSNGSGRVVATAKSITCTAMVADKLHAIADPTISSVPPPPFTSLPLTPVP